MEVCVSAPSVSASLSLLQNAGTYLRLRHASEMLAGTDRLDLRIWSVSENLSSDGNVFVSSKICIANSIPLCHTVRSLKLRATTRHLLLFLPPDPPTSPTAHFPHPQ